MRSVLSRRLIGRRAEQALLDDVVRDARAGRGRAVALVGGAGVGKSRLVRHATDAATRAELRVVVARANPGGVDVPYQPIAEIGAVALRDPTLRDHPRLLPLRPVLDAFLPTANHAGLGELDATRVGETLLRVLEVAAADRGDRPDGQRGSHGGRRGGRGAAVGSRGSGGALVVVEDLQWVDAGSAEVVRYLVDHIDAHGAAIVVSVRDQPASAALDQWRRLGDRRAAEIVEVGPLPAADVDRMVLDCLGQDAASDELLRFVREHADGIPFLVEELLAGAVRAGAVIADGGTWRPVGRRLAAVVPDTLAASIAARFQATSERTQRVLVAAAVLGRDVDWRVLEEVAQLPADELTAALREATYSHLLETSGGSVRFRHALTRDHLLRLTPPPERQRVAARALRALERGDPAAFRDTDLAADLAAAAGDPATAAGHLLASARRWRERGGLDGALTRLERAAVLAAADTDLRDEVVALQVAVEALRGSVDRALRLSRTVLPDRHRSLRRGRTVPPDRDERSVQRGIEVRLGLARALVGAGRPDEAEPHLTDATTLADGLADAAWDARVAVVAAEVERVRGRTGTAIRRCDDALAADRLPPEVRCELLAIRGRCLRLRDLGRAERDFEAARAVAHTHGLRWWEAHVLHELGTIDLLDTLRTDRLEAARRAAVAAGAPATEAMADFHLASALVARGESRRGRAVAQRCERLARRLGLAVVAYVGVVTARSHVVDRDRVAATREVARIEREHGDDAAVAASVLSHVSALDAMLDGDRVGALAALDRAVDLLERHPGHHDPHRGWWALLRCTEAGDDAAVEQAAAAAGSDTRLNRVGVAAAAAVVTGRRGTPADAEERWRAVARDLDGFAVDGAPRALTLWLAAPAALADGWGDPQAWLADVVRWSAPLGYDGLATAARVMLRDAGGTVPRAGRGTTSVPSALRRHGVTGREVDVLTLVHEGLTNREIAARLVLAPKTVEKHVSSLLRKTSRPDRRSLAELADAIWG